MVNINLAIKATCKAILNAGFPSGTDPRDFHLHPANDPLSQAACVYSLEKSIEFQQQDSPGKPPKIWTLPLIKNVKDYAKKYGISVFTDNGLPIKGIAPFLVRGGKIVLRLDATVGFTESSLLFWLGHEHGHIKDNKKLLEASHPGSTDTLRDGLSQRSKHIIELCRIYIDLFRSKVPPSQREKFDTLLVETFGDPPDFDQFAGLFQHKPNLIIQPLSELLRWGEEIADPRMQEHILPTAMKHFGKAAPENFYREAGFTSVKWVKAAYKWEYGKFVDLVRLIIVAYLQEAGLWEKVVTSKDYNPEIIKQFNPSHIEFFRMCLRASRQYFKP